MLGEAQFAADLKRARSGRLSVAEISRLIDKWGQRGGAFYAFLRAF